MSEIVFCISKTFTSALLYAGRTMPLCCCWASHFIVAASHKYIHNRIWCSSSCGDTHDCCSLHFPFTLNYYFDDIARANGECNDILPFICSNIFAYSVSICIPIGNTNACTLIKISIEAKVVSSASMPILLQDETNHVINWIARSLTFFQL